ncbi:Soj-like protein [Poriferisphaera corsica]|uniref:Soj-like protein n=1 Tax=Poriferisphaera corsica TaxID=2528020 RepID=A0A517YYW7_9BACT|nr:ParA family protein [Poriferisphaera corsica]QDU35422.1 Soj-like protein [Poriferisphaera corsica]
MTDQPTNHSEYAFESNSAGSGEGMNIPVGKPVEVGSDQANVEGVADESVGVVSDGVGESVVGGIMTGGGSWSIPAAREEVVNAGQVVSADEEEKKQVEVLGGGDDMGVGEMWGIGAVSVSAGLGPDAEEFVGDGQLMEEMPMGNGGGSGGEDSGMKVEEIEIRRAADVQANHAIENHGMDMAGETNHEIVSREVEGGGDVIGDEKLAEIQMVSADELLESLDERTGQEEKNEVDEPAEQSEKSEQEVAVEKPVKKQGGEVKRLKSPRVIALMNQKGGVGKTTTAVNLGAALGRLGYRVLLLDLDPQAHLTLYLGVDPEQLEQTIYDLLVDDEVTAADIRQSIEGYEKLDVLPADVSLAGVESELADKVVTGAAQSVLRTKVKPIAKEYDFILLDCPPSLGLLTINALTLSKEVIVPMQAHFLALQGMGKLFETITMLRQGFNPNLQVAGIVLCMHEGQTILAGEVIGDLEGFLEGAQGGDEPWSQAKIFDPPIRRNIKLAESPSFGQSIFDYDVNCNGAQDYMQLAECVANHELVWDF